MLKKDTLSNYKATNQIEWANALPENCPPENILVPYDEEFYRVIKNEDRIVEDDWKTYIELFPEKKFSSSQILLANGLSITKSGDLKKLKKLPSLRNHKGLAKLRLKPTDGVLQKTGKDDNHYTWWRTTSFDPQSAEIVKNDEA